MFDDRAETSVTDHDQQRAIPYSIGRRRSLRFTGTGSSGRIEAPIPQSHDSPEHCSSLLRRCHLLSSHHTPLNPSILRVAVSFPSDNVLLVELKKPHASTDLWLGGAAFERIADDTVGVVVLSSALEKGFSVGLDSLKYLPHHEKKNRLQ